MSEQRSLIDFATAIGLVIGAGVGLLFGVLGPDVAAPWIAVGASIGLVAGAVVDLRSRQRRASRTQGPSETQG